MRLLAQCASPAILLLALALRVMWLDEKPPHFDEGVNGFWVDQMTRQGFYHYDPTNFHGPLHFYVLFVAQTLFGREVWALRLPLALVSTGCVALVLAFRCHLGRAVCQVAALAMAISPAMVFYGRYAIHETWLLFFLMLAVWGGAGLWRFGERRHLWAAGLGLTGMVLIKETYVIHAVALVAAVPCLLLYEMLSRSSKFAWSGWKFGRRDLLAVAGVSAGLIVFFYSGGLLDWPGPRRLDEHGRPLPLGSLAGLYECFGEWISTGTAAHLPTGHEKPWHYWLQLLAGQEVSWPKGKFTIRGTIASEWPAALGLLASFALLARGTNRLARYLAISGLGTLIGYSIVAYKTPWCVIVLLWPFYFVFGLAVVHCAQKVDVWVTGVLAGALAAFTLHATWKLNFHHYDDETEPCVYVQTRRDIDQLLGPLRALLDADPRHRFLTGHLIVRSQHPMIWLLADFPKIGYPDALDLPDPLDADILLLEDNLVEHAEPELRSNYFKTELRIRGRSGETQMLYLRQGVFGRFFPGREPEFQPAPRVELEDLK
jgi:uncharacterized protein (TIGR03663 family)